MVRLCTPHTIQVYMPMRDGLNCYDYIFYPYKTYVTEQSWSISKHRIAFKIIIRFKNYLLQHVYL